MRVVQRLEKAGMMACLELLHFHVGSQVPEVQTFKGVLREAGRIYSELVRMGAPMGYLDVGGGLGVDYGGVRGSEGGSRDYRDAEYVGDVVGQLKQVFDAAEVAHPHLITESGRAMVAHSTLLLFEIMGRAAHEGGGDVQGVGSEAHPLQADLERFGEGLSLATAAEVFHGANDVRMQARQAFELGVMSLGAVRVPSEGARVPMLTPLRARLGLDGRAAGSEEPQDEVTTAAPELAEVDPEACRAGADGD